MLHRVNLPECLPQLERIVEFQREVLQYACEGNYQLPLQENELKTLFGDERGVWIWGKLFKKDGNKSKFHLCLEKLIIYYQRNVQEGTVTLAAFDNDILFAKNIGNSAFRFQYPNLTIANQDLIKPLMVSFYEDLLMSGFIEAIHGSPKKLDRDGFIASFWENNKDIEVCPACDSRKSPKINGKVFDDADHFFPKSKYPFLSLHPFNLFPLCIYCNRPIKGDKDIIDNLIDAPLANVFHPYQRPALEKMDVNIFRDKKTGDTRLDELIDIEGMPSRRLSSLDRVFRVRAKWVGELNINKKAVVTEIIEAGIGHQSLMKKYNLTLTPDEIRNELEESLSRKLQTKKDGIGQFPGYILQESYLTCALKDVLELEELYKHFTGI